MCRKCVCTTRWSHGQFASKEGKRAADSKLLDPELLDSVLEAQVLIDDWREEYNTYRPHQSLRYLTPVGGGWRTRSESHNRWTDERGPVNIPLLSRHHPDSAPSTAVTSAIAESLG